MRTASRFLLLLSLIVFFRENTAAEEAGARRMMDPLRHKARDFEQMEPLKKRTESEAYSGGEYRRAAAPMAAAPAPVIESGSSGSSTIHFFNNETLLSQGRGSIPAGTSMNIVNGSSVTGPILHSRRIETWSGELRPTQPGRGSRTPER